MNLKHAVAALRSTVDEVNGYAQIAEMALALAEQETLVEIKQVVPGLKAVCVVADDEGCIESFDLELETGKSETLVPDCDQLIAEGDIKPLLDAMGYSYRDVNPFLSDKVEDKIYLLFDLLNDLPRLRGVRSGNTSFDLQPCQESTQGPTDRDMNTPIAEDVIQVTENSPLCFQAHNVPKNETIFLQVENFDVHIKRTDDGLVVDLFDNDLEGAGESLGSTYAFDQDTVAFK